MAGPQQFNSWQDVSAQYGQDVANQLQNLQVPLDQVGAFAQQAGPAGANFPFIGFAPNISGMGGQQGGQQGPSFNPTQQPNYPTSLLGAQALQAVGLNPGRQVTVNPTPADTPSSTQFAQSGVSSVASPQTTQYPRSTPMPNINPAIGSVFNAVQPLPPTPGPYVAPAYQPTGMYYATARNYAKVPPVQPAQVSGQAPPVPSTLPQPPSAPSGTPGANYTQGVNVDPTKLPHYQMGGIAGLNGPELAVVGEGGPEQISPIYNPNYSIEPIGDPNYSQISGGYSAPAAPDVAPHPNAVTGNFNDHPSRPDHIYSPVNKQMAESPLFKAAAPSQVGPPNPPQTQAQALQSGTQVGPPNPPQQNNPVSSMAQAAASSAIHNTLSRTGFLDKMRPLLGQAQQAGAALQQNAERPRATVQNAIPSPDDFKRKNNQIVLSGANQGFA